MGSLIDYLCLTGTNDVRTGCLLLMINLGTYLVLEDSLSLSSQMSGHKRCLIIELA